MKKLIFAALTGAVAFCAALTASATLLIQMNLEDMAAVSSEAVVGTAIAQSQIENADGLFTVTTFQISDAIYGESGSTIDVYSRGGVRKMNGISVSEVWVGAPQFVEGQELVLLLQNNGGYAEVVGVSQGVMPVVDTGSGKVVMMPGDRAGTPMAEARAKILSAKMNP